jgi:hypothetical protein
MKESERVRRTRKEQMQASNRLGRPTVDRPSGFMSYNRRNER